MHHIRLQSATNTSASGVANCCTQPYLLLPPAQHPLPQPHATRRVRISAHVQPGAAQQADQSNQTLNQQCLQPQSDNHQQMEDRTSQAPTQPIDTNAAVSSLLERLDLLWTSADVPLENHKHTQYGQEHQHQQHPQEQAVPGSSSSDSLPDQPQPVTAALSYDFQLPEGLIKKAADSDSPEFTAAAGVCFYAVHPRTHDLQLLLVEQKGELTFPGGKRKPNEEVHLVAAREVEEEMHWQLKQAQVHKWLSEDRAFYWSAGKYTLFYVHLPNMWRLPSKIRKQLKGGRVHPEAVKVTGAYWVPYNKLIQWSVRPGFRIHFVARSMGQELMAGFEQLEAALLKASGLTPRASQDVQGAPKQTVPFLASMLKRKDGRPTGAIAPQKDDKTSFGIPAPGNAEVAAGSDGASRSQGNEASRQQACNPSRRRQKRMQLENAALSANHGSSLKRNDDTHEDLLPSGDAGEDGSSKEPDQRTRQSGVDQGSQGQASEPAGAAGGTAEDQAPKEWQRLGQQWRKHKHRANDIGQKNNQSCAAGVGPSREDSATVRPPPRLWHQGTFVEDAGPQHPQVTILRKPTWRPQA